MNLNHIGIAVRSIEEQLRLWHGVLGLRIRSVEDLAEQKVRLAMLEAGAVTIELLEPLTADSPIAKFIAKRGEGLHHLSFEVPDINQTIRALKNRGLQMIDDVPRKGAHGSSIAFVHPSSTGGVLIELCQEAGITRGGTMHIETDVVHGGQHPDKWTGALAPPIYQTSTFAFRDADHGARLFKGEEAGHIYTRISNPTIELLAAKIALLESAEAGLIFASGLASIFNVVVATVRAGENVVSDDTIYGGTYTLFRNVLPRLGIEVIFVDATDPERFAGAINERTKLAFIETPANPTLKIIDIAARAEQTRSRGVPLCVDNTFATPCLQRPIEHGADIVVHSATKYFGGHGDIIGGVAVGRKDFIQGLWKYAKDVGASISPFNAWLILRGLKTLAVRMERHCANARKIADYLDRHEKVEKVYYPGLESHPGHDIACHQMRDFGGMIGFDVKGGKEAGKLMMNSVKLCTLAVSLGDVDTLIEHPGSMTHSGYSEKELLECGIKPGFVRLSAGLEHVDDIIADLNQALDRI
ncbi:methylmalonyl-CoA epimerase [candidate division WOR-3 bacterium]|nr:methylmalonyl-CoA epimerase [candidate division WOR-3 bacterium]